MKIVYAGSQPEFSQYFGDAQHSFEKGKPVEVPEDIGVTLVARGDFERVPDAPAPKAAPRVEGK